MRIRLINRFSYIESVGDTHLYLTNPHHWHTLSYTKVSCNVHTHPRFTIVLCNVHVYTHPRYGIGYHLTIVKEPECDSLAVSGLVMQHIKGAEKVTDVGTELSLILPSQSVTQFPGLFDTLESKLIFICLIPFSSKFSGNNIFVNFVIQHCITKFLIMEIKIHEVMGVSEVHEAKMSLLAYFQNKKKCLPNAHGSLSMHDIDPPFVKKAADQTDAPWQITDDCLVL